MSLGLASQKPLRRKGSCFEKQTKGATGHPGCGGPPWGSGLAQHSSVPGVAWLKSCGLEAPPLPAATRDPAGLMLFTGLVSWGYLLASRDPGLKGPHTC